MKIYNRDSSLNPWTVTSSGAIKALSKEPPGGRSIPTEYRTGLLKDY